MRIALLLLFSFLANTAYSSPAEEKKIRSIPILDTAKELLGTRVNYAADKLDSFFATDRADDEFGRSQLRIRTRFFLTDKEMSRTRTQYRLNLKLPSLEKRFKPEYYENDEQRKVTEKKRAEAKREEEKRRQEEKGFFSGWIFNSDISASVAIPPKLILRSRVRNKYRTGTLTHYFMQQLTYTTDATGFVTETSVDSDHTYSEDFVFRFINNFEWQITPKIYQTNHGPTWLYQASEDVALNYGFLTHTLIDGEAWYVDNYKFYFTYRRNLYQQWVYLDITPGLDFPEKWRFTSSPFLNLQLEFLFGGG